MEKLNDQNGVTPNNESSAASKKEYRAPKLLRHGSLAELVQLRPARGADGETRWADCTHVS